jgi:anti-sigma factor RsiW
MIMPCPSFENRILDYLENQLPSAARAEVEAHLVACPACRDFACQLRQLDAALTRHVVAPTLRPEFDVRLHARIENAVLLTETEIAERKRALQADFEARMLQMKKHPLDLAAFFESFGWAALVALAISLFFVYAPGWSSALAAHGLDVQTQTCLLSAVLSLGFALFGLRAVFPRWFRQITLSV